MSRGGVSVGGGEDGMVGSSCGQGEMVKGGRAREASGGGLQQSSRTDTENNSDVGQETAVVLVSINVTRAAFEARLKQETRLPERNAARHDFSTAKYHSRTHAAHLKGTCEDFVRRTCGRGGRSVTGWGRKGGRGCAWGVGGRACAQSAYFMHSAVQWEASRLAGRRPAI